MTTVSGNSLPSFPTLPTAALRTLAALLFCLALQIVVHARLPAPYDNTPPLPVAPTKATVQALALGDTELAYRTLTLSLQQAGDSGLRTTPLKDYDYNRLVQWLELLEELSPQPDWLAVLAAHYFGLTPQPDDLRKIIAFLVRTAEKNPVKKWRWMAQAARLARYRLKDTEMSIDIALKLAALGKKHPKTIPFWTQQMPAFLLEHKGEKEAARIIMLSLLGTDANIPASEKRFMQDYINQRLSK